MVDVDVERRMSCLNPAHVAGLRRLSARATASPPLRNANNAAVDRRRRSLSAGVPKWVEHYVGAVLREGGWCESDIAEIEGVSASGFFQQDMDTEAVLHALLLKTDRLSGLLRKAGWSSQEVSEALGFQTRQGNCRRS